MGNKIAQPEIPESDPFPIPSSDSFGQIIRTPDGKKNRFNKYIFNRKVLLSSVFSLFLLTTLATSALYIKANRAENLGIHASNAGGFGNNKRKSPTPVPFATESPLPLPSTIPASSFLSFGPKQLPYTEFGKHNYTGAYINAGSLNDLTLRVKTAQSNGMKIVVKLAPAHNTMLNSTTGCFDINLWKQSIDSLKAFDFSTYVTDGTVIGGELVNEPHASDWCLTTPRTLTKSEVEEMAAYSKNIWPTLPVGAGRSDWLLANAPWAHLDFGHSQYHMRKGDITVWINNTVQQSKDAGVGLLMSLDFYAGQLDNTPMSATQLDYYYKAMLQDTYSCALTGYLYDATYLVQPEIQSVMTTINDAAKTHPAPPCYVGHVKP